MAFEKIIRNTNTSNKLQEVILNYVILFHDYNRNNYSIKNIEVQTFIKEILDNFSIIYALVNLYRSELDIQTNITDEIRDIIKHLSQTSYNLKEEIQREEILNQTYKLIDLIRNSFNPHGSKSYKCVVPGCEHTAISSHTISRSNNFTKGVDFFRLREKKYQDKTDTKGKSYELMRVSDRKASAHPLFCETHDRKIFLPIENGRKINPFNQKHLFLQNWRTFTLHHARTKEKKDIFMGTVLQDSSKVKLITELNITDYMNSLDGKMYRNIIPHNDYLSINFTLKKTPPILASVILDLKYIAPEFERNTSPFVNETVNFIYIHILPNGDSPIVNISALNDDLNYQAMMHLYSLYQLDQQMFWNKIIQFISTSSNLFFNGSIIYPNNDFSHKHPTYEKLEALYSEIHKSTKDIYNIPDYYRPIDIEFSKKELNHLFAHTAIDCNFIDEN